MAETDRANRSGRRGAAGRGGGREATHLKRHQLRRIKRNQLAQSVVDVPAAVIETFRGLHQELQFFERGQVERTRREEILIRGTVSTV
jgi:hypothetical protein